MQIFTALEYLKIDIASNFGLDKETWDSRLDWFKANEADLENLLPEAEEPAMFYAGVQAYRQALEGKAVTYPISLDATASGAQILAALIKCKKSAEHCNLVDTGDREDFYTNMHQAIIRRANETGVQHQNLTRSQAKEGIMPWFYGSKKEPENVFGDGDLLKVFYQTMEEDAPGLTTLNQSLINVWRPDVTCHKWTLPDNFHVLSKVRNKVTDNVKFLDQSYDVTYEVIEPKDSDISNAANIVHSIDGMIVREMMRRCMYDTSNVVRAMEAIIVSSSHSKDPMPPRDEDTDMVSTLLQRYRDTGFMSARIIDYVTKQSLPLFSEEEREALWQLLDSLPNRPFYLLTVHDCFRCHPNHANELRRTYNQILAEIADSRILEDIVGQIYESPVNAAKMDLDPKDILEANYALS